MPYLGTKGNSLYQSCINKIKRHLKDRDNVLFILMHDTIKVGMFCSKDTTPKSCRSNVVYQFKCPGCNSSYVGKTERTMNQRTVICIYVYILW